MVANIPYNITTPIVFRLLERPRPRDIVLMVQDEVADRIVFMEEGRVVEIGTPQQFFTDPKSDRTKLFLSQIL